MTAALAPAALAPASLRPPDAPPPSDVATHRSVVAHVTGGLDGALRVLTMLRGRRYRVRDLGLDVGEGVLESRVTCTAVLTRGELDLLLLRLRRLPTVVSAEQG